MDKLLKFAVIMRKCVPCPGVLTPTTFTVTESYSDHFAEMLLLFVTVSSFFIGSFAGHENESKRYGRGPTAQCFYQLLLRREKEIKNLLHLSWTTIDLCGTKTDQTNKGAETGKNDDILLNRIQLSVEDYYRKYNIKVGERLIILYPAQFTTWTVTFTPEGDNRIPNGDEQGNLVMTAFLELESDATLLVVAAVVGTILVVIICCCCVRKCCCKKSSSKRNESAPQTAATPAVLIILG
ncbi:uncharacterized protein AKAME5_001866200, partial [Lates japonicus]